VKLLLRREPKQPSADCTLGLLLIPEASLTLCTMECPWIPSPTCKGGLKDESCVPVGVYQLVKHESKEHGRTWALVNHDLDVVHYEGDDHDPDEDRATCLLHVGNYVRNVKGCIGVGLAHALTNGEHWVTSSTRAMDRLRMAVPWTNDHSLEITQ
jgi:hypothetical protein